MQRKEGELKNRGVVYEGPGKVAVKDLPYPSFDVKTGEIRRHCEHGAIIKMIATNICGSDCHMFRGRTALQPGFTLGHEQTGEVVQVGRDVEFIKVGDIVSVPFNVACGRCFNCKSGFTNACLTTNHVNPGGVYGYVQSGDWPGGQSDYNMIPYADFNLLKIPNRDLAMKKILDLSMITDIFPTGFHAAYNASVGSGSTVFVAGAGPVGLCCARSCLLLGASAVIVSDPNPDRLQYAKRMGCLTLDLSAKDLNITEAVDKLIGESFVDVAIDCVGYEACGHGSLSERNEANTALNDCITAVKYGGNVGIPGVYLPMDPQGKDKNLKQGKLTLDWGTGWLKGLTYTMGQTPVMKYNQKLMNCILWDRVTLDFLNPTVIPLEDAPKAYEEFGHQGIAKKYVIDPHHMITSPL